MTTLKNTAIELVNGVKEAIANCDISAVKRAGDAFIDAMVTVDSVSNPLYVRKSDIMQFIEIFMGDGEHAALGRQRRDDLVTISQEMFEDFIYQNTPAEQAGADDFLGRTDASLEDDAVWEKDVKDFLLAHGITIPAGRVWETLIYTETDGIKICEDCIMVSSWLSGEPNDSRYTHDWKLISYYNEGTNFEEVIVNEKEETEMKEEVKAAKVQEEVQAQAEAVEQTAAKSEQAAETTEEAQEEKKPMTIQDYAERYWTKKLAVAVSKLAVKNAGNNYQQDFISHFVLRSCVFEALTGLRATEWKDKVKIVNLKEGSSQWKICDLLAKRWVDNYAQAQGDKGYRINSQVMVWTKGDCEYRYTPEKGSTIRYRLVRSEKVMIDISHNKKYELTDEKYAAVDKNCKFYR